MIYLKNHQSFSFQDIFMKILHNIETIIHNLHVKFQKSHFNFLGFIDKILYFLSKRFIFLHIFHLIFRENGLRYGFLFFYNLSIIFWLCTNESNQKCSICINIGDIIFLRVKNKAFLRNMQDFYFFQKIISWYIIARNLQSIQFLD